MKILVTGAAGFIGSKVAELLLRRGDDVIGIDNLNDFYDVQLKKNRLKRIEQAEIKGTFSFVKEDVTNQESIYQLFKNEQFDKVVHMAAQANSQFSIKNPTSYVDDNLLGFINILEGGRQVSIKHIVYASSSTVYGLNNQLPFSVHHNTDHPLSVYAALKKANELVAHSYSHLYQIPCTGVRLFSVYGPWDRTDGTLQKFTRTALEGQPIDVYNHGKQLRDFAYIDDIAEGIICALDHNAEPNKHWSSEFPDPGSSAAPWRLYNLGSQNPIKLSTYIEILEKHLGIEIVKNYQPFQPGEVVNTVADINAFSGQFGFSPKTDIEQGIEAFVQWYKAYYN